MQNRWCAADNAGYVTLNGGWACGRCGCANECGDVCRRCGWNRCGCQGGVVAVESNAQNRAGCEAACVQQTASWTQRQGCSTCACADGSARQGTCAACPPDRMTGHSVQCCPVNTSTRPAVAAANAACGCATNAACGGCNCAAAANGSRCCNCTAAAGTSGGCETTYATGRGTECPVEAGVGMVYAVDQALTDVYQSESALRTGTLFPALHKPMNGRCPGSCNCSTTAQQSAFAAWDLRLYLDTHPDDAQALAFFGQLAREAEDPNYATAFLTGGTTWTWTDEPWPWECRPCNAQ